MKRRCLFALSLLPLGLTGCDYYRTTEGTVRDRITHRKLQDVKYQILHGDARDSAYDWTGRDGRVSLTMMSSPDQVMVVRLTKPGYDTML